MNRIWLFGLLLIFLQKSATAGNTPSALNADDLMEECRYVEADFTTLNAKQAIDVTGCVRYVSGVLDGYTVGALLSRKERTMACDIPKEVTNGQMARIVLHYLKDNPADLHLPAGIVVLKAVDKSFPCKTAPH